MISLRGVRLYSRRFPLRRPFRFGIVELQELEHLVVAASFLIDGRSVTGYAGENLVPRWFLKNPALSIDEEIALLRRSVRAVSDAAMSQPQASSPFDLWRRLHTRVRSEAIVVPPLLAQLGESLVERAALDAWCTFHRSTIHDALRDDRLGIDLGRVHAQFERHPISRNHLVAPPTHLLVRHTVGLADDPAELPRIVEASGIHRLKIKLSGDPTADADRLHNLYGACILARWSIDRITLDGNENYDDLSRFTRLIEALRGPQLAAVLEKLVWIEQPFRRDIAFSDEVATLLKRQPLPPMIIDESDASPADLPHALEIGYAGTTHKNCKGVFNSIIHRAVLTQHAAAMRRPVILSGEDLTIVAPWSQASDLMVAAAVGVSDVERNGNHFADGLSGFGHEVSEQALLEYPSLYRRRADGVAELSIVAGRVAVPTTMVAAPPLDSFTELTD